MTTVFSNGKILLADHRRSVTTLYKEKTRHRQPPAEGKYSNDQSEKIIVPPALAHKGSRILAFAAAGDVKMILMVRDFLCEAPYALLDSPKKFHNLDEANISLTSVVARLRMMPAIGECHCSVLLIDDLERTHLLSVEPERAGPDRGLRVRHQVGTKGTQYGIGSGYHKYKSISQYLKDEPSIEDKFMIALKLDPSSSSEFSAFIGKSGTHYKQVRHNPVKKAERLSAIFSSIPDMMMMYHFDGAPTVEFTDPFPATNKL